MCDENWLCAIAGQNTILCVPIQAVPGISLDLGVVQVVVGRTLVYKAPQSALLGVLATIWAGGRSIETAFHCRFAAIPDNSEERRLSGRLEAVQETLRLLGVISQCGRAVITTRRSGRSGSDRHHANKRRNLSDIRQAIAAIVE